MLEHFIFNQHNRKDNKWLLLSLLVQLIRLYFLLLLQKKGAKKSKPILMRNISPLDHSSAKIGGEELNYIEHFRSNIMQDGMNCLC